MSYTYSIETPALHGIAYIEYPDGKPMWKYDPNDRYSGYDFFQIKRVNNITGDYIIHTLIVTVINNDLPSGQVTITGTRDGEDITYSGTEPPKEDDVLKASNNIEYEDGVPDITYTWSNGEIGDSITLSQDDVGNRITVTASYTDGEGKIERGSYPTLPVVNVDDLPEGDLIITGTRDGVEGIITYSDTEAPIQYDVLTADTTDLDDEDVIDENTFTYQ